MQIVFLRVGPGEVFYAREYPSFPFELNGLRFTTDRAESADWLVQSSSETRPTETTVPHERRILVMAEPSGYFPAEYVNQFGILVSPFGIPGYRGIWEQSHGALPAFFGMAYSAGSWRQVLDYRGLINLPTPRKRDALSVVVSRKSVLAGHRRRLEFVRRLAAVLGPRLEIYGRGFREVQDKADAILPFRYHLVLENTVMPSYWTEKLADAWLGYAFPIVSGPPDLARWFPGDSFLPVDISEPDGAIAAIARAMDDNLFDTRSEPIRGARTRLMRDERLCPMIGRVIAAHPNAAPRLPIAKRIEPPSKPGLLYKLRREAARAYWQAREQVRPRSKV